MHVIRCGYCEKDVKAKVIKRWRRVVGKKEDYRNPVLIPDEDGDDFEAVYPKKKVILQYKRLLILHHKRGILKRHRCQGSGKKKVIKHHLKQ